MTHDRRDLTDPDAQLSSRLRAAGAAPPPFDVVWRSAEARLLASRRRYRQIAVAAAVFVALAIGIRYYEPVDELRYVDMAELLESTAWTAPSDALLPERQFDIYQDLPRVPESTKGAGGTLL